ncbi:MAG: bifunctional DNA primase/polymerase [Pseudomonadota bacterium]
MHAESLSASRRERLGGSSPFPALAAAALKLAETRGLAVFSCRARSKMPLVGPLRADGTAWVSGQHPIEACATRGGFHRATTNADQTRQWWDRWPDANVGVRLGTETRLCLIEADTDAADAHLARLAADWPPTWTYRASRGVNRLFRAPPDNLERPIRHLWPESLERGVEFKNGLGFFVAPPSIHPSGHHYAWVDGAGPDAVPLAPLPDTVADEVRRLDARRVRATRPIQSTPYDRDFHAWRTLDALRYLWSYQTFVEGAKVKRLNERGSVSDRVKFPTQ